MVICSDLEDDHSLISTNFGISDSWNDYHLSDHSYPIFGLKIIFIYSSILCVQCSYNAFVYVCPFCLRIDNKNISFECVTAHYTSTKSVFYCFQNIKSFQS